MTRANSYVGQPMLRVEDERLLTGKGVFVDDIHLPDMLHAAILRSQAAHARIRGIDAAGARALPGVIAVLTAADLPHPLPRIPVRIAPIEGAERFLQPVIAEDRARYVGEPLAIVIAESQAVAEDARELIEVDLEPLDPVADIAAARAGASVLHPEAATNVVTDYHVLRGDPATADDGALYRRTERFRVQRHTAVPMETRGLVAEWDAARGRMIVRGAAKIPFFNRKTLAAMLGLARDDVDLEEFDVGGGFGVRGEFYPEDFLVPFAARVLGRPVKWIEDRHEHLMATAHSREMECELEITCTPAGKIVALRGEVAADLGAYVSPTGPIVPTRAAQFLAGCYHVPVLDLRVVAALSTKTPVGSYRGPGRFEATFFRERLFDMAARDLGIPPDVFRRQNLIAAADLPYGTGRMVPYEAPTSYDTGDYQAVFDLCLEKFGWAERAKLQGTEVEGRLHGLGLACVIDSSGAGPRENAHIFLGRDGRVRVHVGSSALGQGIETTFTQIVADELGLHPDRIEVLHGSTRLLDEGFGSFHSRSLIMGGNAIVAAAGALREALRGAAAERFGSASAAVSLLEGQAVGPDGQSLPFEAFAPLDARGSFGGAEKPFGYGTHVAHVAVDVGTGHVDLIDYLAVEDAGRIVNPAIVHGQKIGGIVQGLGGALLEHLVYDEGAQLRTGSLAEYMMPTAADFPRLDAVTLALAPTPRNPLGVKGAGEDAIAAAGAAVANAVAAALSRYGVEPLELPLDPPRVWALVNAARPNPSPDRV